MVSYKIYNRLAGWIVFLIAAFVYLSTIEPTSSLWDCGEFIASAYKLQVGHPPGAPFFMLLGRVFSLLAGNNVEKVAMMINSISALASAFTIMFLFWTITHLAKKILVKDNNHNTGNIIAIIGSGLVGALAYTFSDTFWFSAVEGEVYATSSLFTAVVFWAILKWENVADEQHADRWLVFIAFLMGLSLGVHLLNLLAIPAIVLVYYFRKYKVTPGGIIISLLISGFILLFIQFGVIQYVLEFASLHELLFVNKYGMPYNSGVIIFLGLIIIFIISGIAATHAPNSKSEVFYLVSFIAFNFVIGKVILGLILNIIFLGIYFLARKDILAFLKKFRKGYNLILVCFAVILIGYSSYTIIIIRSLANPPMDENNPEHVFALLPYLSREQYGERPLIKGQYFNAPPRGTKKGDPTYTQIDGKYKITNHKMNYTYDKEYMTLFPRMYSRDNDHINVYIRWSGLKERDLYEPRKDSRDNIMRDRNGNIIYDRLAPKKAPSFINNLKFLFKYQIGHMYFRYFMWNFAGRQNDVQGFGDALSGNWISGIPFIDKAIIGSNNNMPDDIKNKPSRNKYYFLPFLLGIVGLIYQLQKDVKNFWVVMLLFILTGVAIVFYLNQTPNQPRERDYAYAASFYAFAIWIGLGVLGIINAIKKDFKSGILNIAIIIVCLLIVPGIMAKENWDDHDRSNRFTTRDIAYNYLNSCAPNAILFTNGDNDTFPLWYAQEVEGIRTDVRVVNLMLLNMDWYIDQMKIKAYESDPLPITLSSDKYRMGTRDVVYINDRINEFIDLKNILQFVESDLNSTKLQTRSGEKYDYIPTRKFKIPVDSAKVISNGTVKPENADKIVKSIEWTINNRYLGKSELIVLDILANNNWERPVYYVSTGHEGLLNLENYLQLEGLAYRLVPVKTTPEDRISLGRIDPEIMYDNLMNRFKWAGINDTTVYFDNYHVRTFSIIRFRHRFNRLASELIKEGKKDKAIEVLDRCVELTPHKNIPYDMFMITIAENYYKCGAYDKANSIIEKYLQICDGYLRYYLSQNRNYLRNNNSEIQYNFQIIKNLVVTSQLYKQNELAQKAENILNIHYNDYSLKMVP